MNKRFWMAFVACYIVGAVLSMLIHGVWLGDTYKALAHVWRPEADMQANQWIMFITGALVVFAFCYIFTKGYEGRGIPEGLRYGAWVALLCAIPQAFDNFVIYPIPADLAVKWAVSGLVYFMVLGAVLAAIYKPDAAAA